MAAKKKSLTMRQVKLLWAHAEVRSPRWRAIFGKQLGDDLCRKAESLDPEQLSEEEQNKLIRALEQRRTDLVPRYVETAGRFEFVTLTPEKIAKLYLIPEMWKEKITFEKYISYEVSPLSLHDPRAFANQILTRPGFPPPLHGHPMIFRQKGVKGDMLFEGFTRCTVFLKRHQQGMDVPPVEAVLCVKE